MPADNTSTRNNGLVIKTIAIKEDENIIITMNYDYYHTLCIYSGNSCKADSWIAALVVDVCDLSDDTIKSYLKIRLLEMASRSQNMLYGTTAKIEEAKIISVEHGL